MVNYNFTTITNVTIPYKQRSYTCFYLSTNISNYQQFNTPRLHKNSRKRLNYLMRFFVLGAHVISFSHSCSRYPLQSLRGFSLLSGLTTPSFSFSTKLPLPLLLHKKTPAHLNGCFLYRCD
jgi:hypothetical protein